MQFASRRFGRLFRVHLSRAQPFQWRVSFIYRLAITTLFDNSDNCDVFIQQYGNYFCLDWVRMQYDLRFVNHTYSRSGLQYNRNRTITRWRRLWMLFASPSRTHIRKQPVVSACQKCSWAKGTWGKRKHFDVKYTIFVCLLCVSYVGYVLHVTLKGEFEMRFILFVHVAFGYEIKGNRPFVVWYLYNEALHWMHWYNFNFDILSQIPNVW